MWRRIDRGREYVCWKEGGKQRRQLAHRWEWEQAHGPIPDGHEVHHRDGNPLNNDLRNLQCLPAGVHDDLHGRLREDHRVVNGEEQRRCQRCREYRALAEFSRRTAGTFQGYCRPCQREYNREWRAANREHWNAYHRAYRKR